MNRAIIWLTPWSRVLLEKPIITHSLNKFSTFYWSLKFITTFRRVRHRSLSWATWIQFTTFHPHFKIILSSMPRSSEWFLTFRFSYHCSFLVSLVRATCPAHLIHLNLFTLIIIGEGYKTRSSSLCNLLHSPATSSSLGLNIHLNTPFSDTLNPCSLLSVRDQVSHPYNTKGKIRVLYILIFEFLDKRQKDKRFWKEW